MLFYFLWQKESREFELCMAKQNENNKNKDCKDCIYKNHKEESKKKVIESLKQLEEIKNTLLSIIKISAYPSMNRLMRTKAMWKHRIAFFV